MVPGLLTWLMRSAKRELTYANKDLIVRVAGYSAFFNVLSKATQDDIIGRTEQELA